MSFDEFKTMISALSRVHKVGVRFFNDTEKGKYIARLNNGQTITGCASGAKLTIRNGKYHMFQVPVADLMRAV